MGTDLHKLNTFTDDESTAGEDGDSKANWTKQRKVRKNKCLCIEKTRVVDPMVDKCPASVVDIHHPPSGQSLAFVEK